MVGRGTSAGNMQWDPIIKTFMDYWKSLVDRKKDDYPDIPKITKSVPVIKWTEVFSDFLAHVVGSRTVPLSYVIWPVIHVMLIGPLQPGQPYSQEFELLEEGLVARASHMHALYKEDNVQVYFYLEEATR